MNILYLHGFRSSPQSMKARLMAAHFAATSHRFVCPHCPLTRRRRWRWRASSSRIGRCRARLGADRLITGGYYATWLAERYGCRAALLNPAVLPADDLAGYVASTRCTTQRTFEWRAEYLQELLDLRIERITQPERYFR